VNLVLNIVLVWSIGVVGAALATLGSVVVSAGLAYSYIPDIDLDVPWRTVGVQIISASFMGIIVEGVSILIGQGELLFVAGYVVLGVICYVLGVVVLSDEARVRVRQVFDELNFV
jgi:O-antigen/teichoic acid export membrane protein